jgi:hypothetical protein
MEPIRELCICIYSTGTVSTSLTEFTKLGDDSVQRSVLRRNHLCDDDTNDRS